MITFQLAKLFFGKAFDFIAQYFWQVALAIAIAVLFLYRSAYLNTTTEYSEHLTADKVAATLAKETNKIIEANTRRTTALEIEKHKKVIATLQVDKTELKKKVGDLYAIKSNADFRLASYRDLQLLHANSDNSASAEPASDTERLTSCRRQLDATDTRLSVVEEACAVTTADFNLARGWIDGVCANHKCTDEVTK